MYPGGTRQAMAEKFGVGWTVLLTLLVVSVLALSVIGSLWLMLVDDGSIELFRFGNNEIWFDCVMFEAFKLSLQLVLPLEIFKCVDVDGTVLELFNCDEVTEIIIPVFNALGVFCKITDSVESTLVWLCCTATSTGVMALTILWFVSISGIDTGFGGVASETVVEIVGRFIVYVGGT